MPYINELKQSMSALIHKKQEHCDKGGTPTTGIFDYVRTSTHDLINLAQGKKDDVVQRLKKEIADEIVHPFEEIERTENEIQKVSADIFVYGSAADNYAGKSVNKEDYELFNNYYDEYQEKRKKNKKEKEEEKKEKSFPYYDNIRNTAKRESQIIVRKKRKGFILCILITIFFTVLDSFMLYEPFSIGNVGDTGYSIIAGIIFAMILDALPSLLGIISAEIKNSEKMIELKRQAIPNVESELRGLRRYKRWSVLVWILTGLMFSIYIVARVILFIGGDDFNIGLNLVSDIIYKTSLVENPEEIERNFAAISAIAPIGSSLIALLLSTLVTETESKYVDSFNIKMRDVLQDISTQCDTQRHNLINQKAALIEKKEKEMAELWAHYGNMNMAIPDEFTDFMIKVTAAAQANAIATYSGTYEAFCREARSYTEIEINTLKETLSSYSNKPVDVMKMPITDEEKAGLDYIWNMNGEQHPQTTKHINDLNSYIANILSKWKKSDYSNKNLDEDKPEFADYEEDFDFDTKDLNFQ